MSEVYNQEVAELLKENNVDPDIGLSESEAAKRLKKFGYNQFKKHKKKHALLIFLSQFKNSITALLLVASTISFLFGDLTEALAIMAVLVINAVIGFILEIQAVRSMEALKKLDLVYARVIRSGLKKEVESREVVPGDVLAIEAGDLITADARIISNSGLIVNESVLTGESIPVVKSHEKIDSQVILADRVNMVFKGTAVTGGNGLALVTATGLHTAVGEISELVELAEKDEIPLNKKLNQFSHKLIWLTVLLVVPFLLTALIRGENLYLMMETAIALAVAAIPEGLPIVATIALARGMLLLADRQVIVKKLAAVETLGETNVIMTDKTGTLTENILKADIICLPERNGDINRITSESINQISDDQEINALMRVAVLCNNAEITNDKETIGDPIEGALLELVDGYNRDLRGQLKNDWKKVKEIPFDSDTRIMVTLHRNASGYTVSAKGASAEILDKSSRVFDNGQSVLFEEGGKQKWMQKTNELSAEGLKVLAFACNQYQKEPGNFQEDLIFIGLVGFLDPPRTEVPQSIADCHHAGIKVIMVTGDHPETAKSIANKIKLTNDPDELVVHGREFDSIINNQQVEDIIIFSRVSPKQKLELVNYYQNLGWVVGMTGDGVNDAPALRKADIGVAMGLRGTQVAKEAADMVLQDDSFASIVRAVKQGRIIFDNIKNFVIYLLSCNLSEILVVAVASFSNLSLPLLPMQILFLNLVTDVFPALALGMGKGDPSIMDAKPRKPKEPILSRENWFSIAAYSVGITLSVLAVFLYALLYRGFSGEICNNIAFFTLALAQLLHPLNLIEIKDNFFKNEIVTNPHLWSAVIFCMAILLGAYHIGPVTQILNLVSLSMEHLYMIVAGSILPLILIRLAKISGLIR